MDALGGLSTLNIADDVIATHSHIISTRICICLVLHDDAAFDLEVGIGKKEQQKTNKKQQASHLPVINNVLSQNSILYCQRDRFYNVCLFWLKAYPDRPPPPKKIWGGMMVQWLSLLPHSKKVLGLNFAPSWAFSVRSLDVLPMPVRVSFHSAQTCRLDQL